MHSWLDLRRLRYFKAIAEAGSLSGASRRLRIAQPALTHHLRELERDHGAPLFTRSRTGVELTPSGKLLLQHALVILRHVQDAEDALRVLQQQQRARSGITTVRLAVIPSLATKLTPRLLARAAEALPDISLHIIEAYTKESHELIAQGAIDVAINIANDRWLERDPLIWEDLFFIASPRHRANVPGPIRLAEVTGETLVMPSTGKPVRECLEDLCRTHALQTRVVLEIDGLNPRKEAVIENLGCTFLPWVNVVEEYAAGSLIIRPIVDPPVNRLIVMEKRQGFDAELATSLREVIVPLLELLTRRPAPTAPALSQAAFS
jgi:LysR family nitrogen assimilation transcriptional regulator